MTRIKEDNWASGGWGGGGCEVGLPRENWVNGLSNLAMFDGRVERVGIARWVNKERELLYSKSIAIKSLRWPFQ